MKWCDTVIPLNMSKAMLQEWARNVGEIERGSGKLNKRILKTLRPIGYPIWGRGLYGRQMIKEKATKIMYNTQDILLLLMSTLN